MKKMLGVEGRLFVREPANVFFTTFLPVLLLVGLGSVIPGFAEPSADFGGGRFVDSFVPSLMLLSLVMVAVLSLPGALATARQLGLMRRLATTPVGPARLLGVQVIIHAVVHVISLVLVLVAAGWLFDVGLPASLGWFVVVLVLGVAAFFGIGVLIGSVKTAAAAQGVGMAVMFPMFFFAGVYFPLGGLPEAVQRVAVLTPAGAMVRALEAAWMGATPSASNLAVLAAFAVLSGLVAVRTFRWE